MRVPVCTKITPEQKEVLQFLAHSRNITPSKMISDVIVAACNLDSEELRAKARSFFEEGVRRVEQNIADINQPAVA